jgi:predicted dehydrogenase
VNSPNPRHRRILVVGAGSIGSRHIRNLVELGASVSVFRYRTVRVGDLEQIARGLGVVETLEEGMENADGVVIANRTSEHLQVAMTAAKRKVGFFVEKPLSHSLDGVETLVRQVDQAEIPVEVGLMMRFHPNLRELKRLLTTNEFGSPLFARATVGQYLPDWRPGTDHRSSYSASRSEGGVTLDLIHEIDLMLWFFGQVNDVAALTLSWEALEIESESVAQIAMQFQSGVIAQVHLDYVRPAYYRRIEVGCERGVLEWDYNTGTLTAATKEQTEVIHRLEPGFQRNDMFLNHMRHFLRRIEDPSTEPAVPLAAGVHSLRVALAARLSAETRHFLKPAQLEVAVP